MLRFATRTPTLLILLFILAGCGTKDPYAPILDLTELVQDAGSPILAAR